MSEWVQLDCIVEDRNVSDGPRERMLKLVKQIITKAMEDMNGTLE